MKYSYNASPNYRAKRSTDNIMFDITLGLLVVLIYACIWYGLNSGWNYSVRIVCMALVTTITAILTEAIYFKVMKKEVGHTLKHSYVWVTALIITLITKINVSFYALIIATVIAVLFGKLIFGGFGQNIFNPAAFAEAIIMNSFAASVAPDFTTGSTPMATFAAHGWVVSGDKMNSLLDSFHHFGGLILGNYFSTIGGSFALVILIVGAYLIYKKAIDWRLSCTYLLSVLIMSLAVGIIHGNMLAFTLLNLFGGGVIFGAIFMLTDPVTSPVSTAGKYIFAIGSAMLTLLIRWKANLPDGVLFSILLMNMLTVAIDNLVDGSQVKDAKMIWRKTAIIVCVSLVIPISVGAFLKPKEVKASEKKVAEKPKAKALKDEDFSSNAASCSVKSKDGTTIIYSCKAKGFENESAATITVDTSNKTVKKVVVDSFGDTKGVGDLAISEEALKRYAGVNEQSSVEVVSGATFTSTGIKAMVYKALQMAEK